MKNIRHLLEALPLGLIFLIFFMLPVRGASWLGGQMGRWFGPVFLNSCVARKNLSLAFPDMSVHQRSTILHGMYNNLGRIFSEYPHLQKIAQHYTICDVTAITEHLESGKPAIYVTGHIGNWELPSRVFYKQTGQKIAPIYRAPNNPYLAKVLRFFRGNIGFPKSRTGMLNALKALKKNENIGILFDQKYNEGNDIPFFGHMARTSLAAVQMAQKYQCPIIPLRMTRTHNCHYTLSTYAPIHIDKDDDIEKTMHHLNLMLESWIKDTPEQWLWVHKRWKKENYDSL